MMISQKNLKWMVVAALSAVIVSGCSKGGTVAGVEDKELQKVELDHIHGMSYSADGNKLFFASHDGLRIYAQGQWIQPAGEKHDYMGFSMVSDGFYSSGHPAPGSSKKNPFGIVKSVDEGRSFESLALYGEVDFHGMSVGYESHAIYVFNPEANSAMKSIGLHYSVDEANSWTQSAMIGLEGKPMALAVHPTEKAIVAVGTDQGVFVSEDFGQQFKKITPAMQVSALHFNVGGKLLAAGMENQAVLTRMDLDGNHAEKFRIPSMTQDAIAFIAQNPLNESELTIMTFGNDAYYSSDNGDTWTKIIDKGIGVSGQK